MYLSTTVVLVVAFFCALPWVSSALALFFGIFISLVFQFKLPTPLKASSRIAMQTAIVLLGFSMSPSQMVKSGTEGLVVTFVSLVLTLFVGWVIGRFMRLEHKLSFLISCGSGICGGTAINSIAPIIRASEAELAVSLACVFILNAVALTVFPYMGHFFELSPLQFGWLAAIAIHDTSSVVGAATIFSPESVDLAITAKLTRALWIIPLMVVTTFFLQWHARRSQNKTVDSKNVNSSVKPKWPVFIFIFIGAVLLHGILPDMPKVYYWSDIAGKSLLKVAIFFMGLQLTRKMIRDVGFKSMSHATLLWFLVTGGTLAWVINFV
jgi:uncharacterized integral membrane protein (TIGR00698 family)